MHVDARETADRVRDQECVPVADETASGSEVADYSCRTLVVDMHQRPIVACLEPRLDNIGINVLTPRHVNGLDVGTDRGADGGEALAPLSIADDQGPLARRKDVDKRSFHHAGTAASEQQRCVLSAEDWLQVPYGFGQYFAEIRPAMRDHRRSRGSSDTVRHRCRSWKTQSIKARSRPLISIGSVITSC